MSAARIFTKPCERADRGCCGLAWATTPKKLAKRRFCSCRCNYLNKVETGTQPKLTPEAVRRGGLVGGRASAEIRRSLAVHNAVRQIEDLIPQWLDKQLDDRGRRALRVLIAWAWKRGRKGKLNANWHAKHRPPKTPPLQHREEEPHDDLDATLAAL